MNGNSEFSRRSPRWDIRSRCFGNHAMRIEHELDCSALIEIRITSRRIFQRNNLRVDDVGDGQTVVPDCLHELTIVTQRGRLAGVERMRFRPTEAEPQ